MNEIKENVFSYLKSPRDKAVTSRLVEAGPAAFEVVRSYAGPYPPGLDPRDAGDLLTILIGRIGSRWPEVIRENIGKGNSWARYIIVSAALSTGDPQFADLIIERINDRSWYIVDMVLEALQQHEYLQVEDAVPRLRRLLASKTVNHLMTKREKIEGLLTKIEKSSDRVMQGQPMSCHSA
jgi:hypothetical protein